MLWPVKPTLIAYKTVIEYKNIWIGYRNSLAYMIVGTGLALILNVMAAFPLSRKEFFGRRFFTVILAITMYVSGGLVPTYLLISGLHMLDTFWVMVVPGATSIWHIIMIRTYFNNSVPEELCGETIKEQEVIPMVSHTPVTVKGYAATCTKAGKTDGKKCSVSFNLSPLGRFINKKKR